MPQYIVINKCFGGFGLSDEAMTRWAELRDITLYRQNSDFAISNSNNFMYYASPEMSEESFISPYDIKRDDPALVQTVRELGESATDRFAELKIVAIPDEVDWEIEEYDGMEWVAEKHRVWS